MTNATDPSLSSLLEKANYIKKAMGNMEEEITQNIFKVKKNGIQVAMKGTHKIERIFMDPETNTETSSTELLKMVQEVVNLAVDEIEKRREEAFKIISQNIQDPEDTSTNPSSS